MKISKKAILIALIILALVSSAIFATINFSDEATYDPGSKQDNSEIFSDDNQIDGQVEDDEDNENQNSNIDIPEEIPPRDVDDRGGYTPY